MSSNNDNSAVSGNCRERCKILAERSERCLQMWTNTEKYAWSHDVTFEVGSPEKVRITAHRLALATSCQYFEDLFTANQNNSKESPLPFPRLDPVGFKKTLHYIYSGAIDFSGSGPKEVSAILEGARTFGLDELVTMSDASLRLQITSDNVVELLQFAQEKCDQNLEDLTRSYISSHIMEVLLPDRILQLSEAALCTLLNLDDWYLDEIQVFDKVKRWAMKLGVEESLSISTSGVIGKLMREGMGRAFFAIRFPLMKKDEFFKRVLAQDHGGLFTGDEIQAFAEYFCGGMSPSSQKCLCQFVCRPRLKTSVVTQENEEIDVVEGPSFKVENKDEDEREGSTLVIVSSNSVSINEKAVQTVANGPPAKKVRIENEKSAAVEACSNSASVQTLVEYVNDLGKRGKMPNESINIIDEKSTGAKASSNSRSTQTLVEYVNKLGRRKQKQNITIIDKSLILTTLPSTRVHLPNLTEFRLTLKSERKFSGRSEFWSYVKESTTKLDQLLFFDKSARRCFTHVTENNLTILLNQKVNISVQFGNCLIFKVCHKEGSLFLNMLNDAQTICNILREFPLKMLAIQTECNLSALRHLRRDILETLVIEVEEAMKDEEWQITKSLVQDCLTLVEFSFINFTSCEAFELGEDLLHYNPRLRKVSLGNQSLELPALKCPGWQAPLTELYLDLRWLYEENLSNYPLMYPFLRRVQFRSLEVSDLLPLLYNILKVRSLESIFISCLDEVNLNKVNLKSIEEKDVLTFLSKIFNFNPETETCPLSFSLEKNPDHDVQSVDGVFDPFDDSKWKGQILMDENSVKIINRLMFENFSWAVFYPKYVCRGVKGLIN